MKNFVDDIRAYAEQILPEHAYLVLFGWVERYESETFSTIGICPTREDAEELARTRREELMKKDLEDYPNAQTPRQQYQIFTNPKFNYRDHSGYCFRIVHKVKEEILSAYGADITK